ncbi:MAG: alpha/beta hydrolase [Herbinix sp.]|jgi:pimeloyl-ACP methyl ester carboxylesterase|nr:alpha/beta hydrolase [Herbinix sp.]
MENYDDELKIFEEKGAETLPVALEQGYIETQGARIWYSTYGTGLPVVLLHGGLGHSGNWGYQVSALLGSGYQVVLIDSRGHGRSTRDDRPFTYQLMASDLLAVLDYLQLEKVGLVGWSDGADTALIFADLWPDRVAGVLFFGCNMDDNGTKQITEYGPTLTTCFKCHSRDYARLSTTPNQFETLVDAVGIMQRTQPNYTALDLARIKVPVLIVQSEHDEFIKREHAEYLAKIIPNAELSILMDVSHFAPLQRPDQFNKVMLGFVGKVLT